MQQKIVIIGNSPLLFFLARKLDNVLANLVQYRVIWLTTEKSMPALSWPSTESRPVVFKKVLENVHVIQTEVKSISLPQKRVVTSKGLVDFDFLLIDQAPYFRASELDRVIGAVDKLTLSLKANLNQGKKVFAQIKAKGAVPEVTQMMLHLNDYIANKHGATKPYIDLVADTKIESAELKRYLSFLNKQSEPTKSKIANMVIEPPRPMVDVRKVRGLPLDNNGNVMTERGGFVLGRANVIVLDEQDRAFQNLLRVQKTFAGQLAASIQGYFEGVRRYLYDHGIRAYKLSHSKGVYVELGDIVSAKLTASIIDNLDKNLADSITKHD